MAPFLPAFLSLPAEIHRCIADFLNPSSLFALRLAHRRLHATLPPPNPAAAAQSRRHRRSSQDRCERLAILAMVEQASEAPKRFRCRVCKSVYPASLFSPATSRAWTAHAAAPPYPEKLDDEADEAEQNCVRGSGAEGTPLELPPRVCVWHASRLASVVPATVRNPPPAWGDAASSSAWWDAWLSLVGGWLQWPTSRRARGSKWRSGMASWCFHCGTVRWRGDGDDNGRACGCTCETCGSAPVRVYRREVEGPEDAVGAFQFVRVGFNDEGWEGEVNERMLPRGALVVVENGGVDGGTQGVVRQIEYVD